MVQTGKGASAAGCAFDRFAAFSVIFVVSLYGLWTLYVWLALALAWDLNQFGHYSFVLLAAPPTAWWLARKAAPVALEADLQRFSTGHIRWPGNRLLGAVSLLLAGGALLGALALVVARTQGDFGLPWSLLFVSVLAAAYFAAAHAAGPGGGQAAPGRADYLSFVVYAVVALSCALLYLFSNATNADDTHFLGAARAVLSYPDLPLFSQDGIFDIPGTDNYIFRLNKGQSWELLAAYLAWIGAADLLSAYYLWLPLSFVVLIPLAMYLVGYRYFGLSTWVGIALAIVFLVSWGVYNHSNGMFFLPRFFQGKGVFVTVMVPVLYWLVRGYLHSLRPLLAGLVCLALIASGGLTSTALYLALAVVGVAYLSFVPVRWRNILQGGIGLAFASVPSLAMTAWSLVGIVAMRELPRASLGNSQANDNTSIYWFFGDGTHLAIVLVLTWLGFAVFALMREQRAGALELTRWWLVLVALALNDPLSEWLASLTGISNVRWRWHWVMPVGLVVMLVGAGAFRLLVQRPSRGEGVWLRLARRSLVVVPFFILAFALQSLGSTAKRLASEPVVHKLNPDALAMASALRDRFPTALALVDLRVAEILPMLDWGGRLIASRELYWAHPYFAGDEAHDRARLQDLVDRAEAWSADDKVFLSAQIDQRGIDVIVLDAGSAHADGAVHDLASLSWTCAPEGVWAVCTH